MIVDSLCRTLHFSMLNLNLQISCLYDNLDQRVISFCNGLTSDFISSANSLIYHLETRKVQY